MNRRTTLGALLGGLFTVGAIGAVGTMGLGLGTAQAALRNSAGGYELQVLVGGTPVRTFYHNGETFALGQNGDRYTLRVSNHTARRIEAVVSVDGRDVIDGKDGDYRGKRGYVVPAYGHIDIDGWRLSQGQAAAFRFSSVGNSYAARSGNAREVGVVGVAVFPERYVPPPRPLYRPYEPPYRTPPYQPDRRRSNYDDGYLGGAEQSAPARESRKGDASTASPAPPPSTPGAGAGRSGGYAPPRDEERAYDKARSEAPRQRPGLGTGFGEAVDSRVYETDFVRQSPSSPSIVLGLRYNNRDGLIAMGVDVDGWRRPYEDVHLRRTAEPFPVNDSGNRGYATPPPGWEY